MRYTASCSRSAWAVPGALVALSVIPLLGGMVRLADLMGGAPVTPANARFIQEPSPIVLHVLTSAVFCVLGTFQFSSKLRMQSPQMHKIAGRIVVPCGLIVGISGLWMTLFYPINTAMQGELLFSVRLVVGCALVWSLRNAVAAIVRRDIGSHRVWMIRAYALGQGAGTQVLVLLPVILISGEAIGLTRDLLMTLAWLINIAVAEWVIRH